MSKTFITRKALERQNAAGIFERVPVGATVTDLTPEEIASYKLLGAITEVVAPTTAAADAKADTKVK